jgi:hypothetical protein
MSGEDSVALAAQRSLSRTRRSMPPDRSIHCSVVEARLEQSWTNKGAAFFKELLATESMRGLS